MLVVNMATMGITDMVRMRTVSCFIVLMFFLLESRVWAKDVQMETSLSTSLSYSDNVDLNDFNKREGFILSVTPSINFTKEGGRVQSNLAYSLTGIYSGHDNDNDNEQYYYNNNDNNQIQHYLNASMISEIIKNSIFLDLDAGITQELLSSNRYSDGESGSQNLTQTYTYGISPSWQKKWGQYANTELNYNYNEVIYDNSGNGNHYGGQNSIQNNIGFNYSSGLAFNMISWDFNYNYSETSYDGNYYSNYYYDNDGGGGGGGANNPTSEIIKVVLGYNYSRQLELTFTTGYEDYHSNNNIEPSDSGWALGFIWNPSPRNTLALNIGHRFFGTTYQLDYQHTGKRLNWNVTYNEDVTSQRDTIRFNGQSSVDNPNNIVAPVTDDNYQGGSLYLNRSGRSDLRYSYGKTTIGWGIYHERHYYSDSDNSDEDDYGTDLSWGLNIGKRTTMNTRMSLNIDNDKYFGNKQTRTLLTWSLNRTFTKKTSGYIELGYQNNDSDLDSDSDSNSNSGYSYGYNQYTENKISLGFSHQF